MVRAVFVGREPMTKQHIWAPLAREFHKNGWETVFCENGKTTGDIGFYCEDSSLPGNQGFTVITINGLDQDHVVRPFYTQWFAKENWGLFDLGILPGARWLNGWVTRRPSFRNTPRLGVVPVGWFKADEAVKKHSRSFENKTVKTILYAPQTEQDGKQKLVVEAAVTTGFLLKIKHWEDDSYIELFPSLLTPSYMQNLTDENNLAKEFDNIEIYPVNANFMDTLSGVDLLITDQSSVLYEAAILNIPTLTCVGWKHACNNCKGPQPSPDITISCHPEELAETLSNIKSQYSDLLEKAKLIRDNNFIHLGVSAEMAFISILDVHEHAHCRSYLNILYVRYNTLRQSLNNWLRLKRRAAKAAIKKKLKVYKNRSY
jgi:hypothetical protein